MHRPRKWPTLLITSFAATVVAAGSLFLVACGGGPAAPASGTGTTGASGAPAAAKNVTLRLGYFPNMTHAQPQVGLARGTFAEELGSNVKIETKTFNAGPSAIEALFAGAIDAMYIGPNPAITGYV